MKFNKNPYLFINNLNADVPGKPNPLLLSLLIACKFNGELYTDGEDFVTIIGDKCYRHDGEIDMIDHKEYFRFDKLSLLGVSELYENIKWFFIDGSREETFEDFYLN